MLPPLYDMNWFYCNEKDLIKMLHKRFNANDHYYRKKVKFCEYKNGKARHSKLFLFFQVFLNVWQPKINDINQVKYLNTM